MLLFNHTSLLLLSVLFCWVVKLCSWPMWCLTPSMPPISISVFQLFLLPRISFKIKSQRKTKTITRWCFQGASIRTPSLAIYCLSYLVFLSPARISSCVSACWDWGYHATWIGRSTGRCLYQHFTVFTGGVQPSVPASIRNTAASYSELDLPDFPAGNNLDEEHLHWGEALGKSILYQNCSGLLPDK